MKNVAKNPIFVCFQGPLSFVQIFKALDKVQNKFKAMEQNCRISKIKGYDMKANICLFYFLEGTKVFLGPCEVQKSR